MSQSDAPVALNYRGAADLPSSQDRRADIAKAVHDSIGSKIKCSCGKGRYLKNGFAKGTYRFKCDSCKATASCASFMEQASAHVQTLKSSSVKISMHGKPQIVIFQTTARAEEPEPSVDFAPDAETTDSTPSGAKKRKIADLSMSSDATLELLNGMSLEELRTFALDAHERLVISEKRFQEVQNQLDNQNSRINAIETMLTSKPVIAPNSIDATTVSPSCAEKPNPSWVEIVCRNVPEERRTEVINARKALKPKRKLNPIPAKTKAEEHTGLRIVYADGIQRMRLRELKGFFKSLGFSISKIFSISYIGFATVEFMVDEEYAPLFINQIRTRTDALIVENFEVLATTGKANATLDPKLACQRRLNRMRDRETTPSVVKDLIDRFMIEKHLGNECTIENPEGCSSEMDIASDLTIPNHADVDADIQ